MSDPPGSRVDRPARGSADTGAGDPGAADTGAADTGAADPAAADPGNARSGVSVLASGDHPVDPRTVPVWRWTALLSAFPPAAAAGFFTMIATITRAPPAEIAWLAYPLLLAALAGLVFWYPGARYRRLRYRVDSIGITISDGIVWRTQSALPRARIQHTDISQGPLQRKYGVATLKLYTAGSRFTRIDLPGLAYADAVALRDALIAPSEGDAV